MIKTFTPKIVAITCFCLLFMVRSSAAAPDWLKEALTNPVDQNLIGEASAVVLFNSSSVKISDNGSAKRQSRRALRILSVQGSNLASLVIPISEIVQVKGLKGWRVEPDGTEHKLDKKNIVEVGFEQASGYYTDRQTLVAMFPDVNTGDVVAFEYTVKEKKGVEGLFQSFQFQDSLPVLATSFEVIIPSGWSIFRSGQNLEPVTANESGNRFLWEASNLAYRPDEPFMSPWKKVVRKIEISCHNPGDNASTQFSDWEVASRWGYELHESKSIGGDSLRTMVTKVTRGLTTTEEKVRAIAEYVRDEVRYVAVEIGIGRFQPRDANATLSNRFGDCKDKTTLMRAMLSEIGVSSKPVLALSGGNVDEGLPSPFQFNHCIVSFPVAEVPELSEYIRAQANGWFYFDPTDPSTALGHLPGSLQGTYVLPMARTTTSLVSLPKRVKDEHRTRYSAKASLLEDRSVKATIRISHYGDRAAAVSFARRSQTNKEQIDDYRDHFLSSMNDPVIEDYVVGGADDSIWVTFNLFGKDYLQVSGSMSMLKADFFHADSKNLLKKTKTRVHPIWFGETGSVETIVDWTLSAGWEFQSDRDTVVTECDIAKMTYYMADIGDALRFYSYREYLGGTIDPAEYRQARNFNRKRSASFSTRIIIAESE